MYVITNILDVLTKIHAICYIRDHLLPSGLLRAHAVSGHLINALRGVSAEIHHCSVALSCMTFVTSIYQSLLIS